MSHAIHNITNTDTAAEKQPSVISLGGQSGFLAFYYHSTNRSFYGQKLDSMGNAEGVPIEIISTTLPSGSVEYSATLLASGNIALAWKGDNSTPRIALLNQSGEMITSPEYVAENFTGSAQGIDVTPLQNGGFVVSFSSFTSSADGTFIRKFNDQAIAISELINVDQTESSSENFSSIAELDNGNLAITWTQNEEAKHDVVTGNIAAYNFRGIYLSLTDNNGARLTDDLIINAPGTSAYSSEIIALHNGGFIVAWQQDYSNDSNIIMFQRFDDHGARLGDPVEAGRYSLATTSEEASISLTAMDDGSFLIGYSTLTSGSGATPDNGSFVKHYSAKGVQTGETYELNAPEDSNQNSNTDIATTSTGFVATWEHDPDNTGWTDIQSAVVSLTTDIQTFVPTDTEILDWVDSFDPYTQDGSSFTNPTGFIAPGQRATGSLHSADDKDIIQMGLAAEETYTFNLYSDSNIRFILYDDGTSYTSSSGTDGQTLTIKTTHPSALSYTLEILGDTAGSYTLEMEGLSTEVVTDRVPSDTGTSHSLPGNGAISGIINGSGDQDWYSYQSDGSPLTIEQVPVHSVFGTVAGAWPVLADSSGSLLDSGDNVATSASAWYDGGSVSLESPDSGTYYLVARNYDDSFNDRGTYIVRHKDDNLPEVWVEDTTITETDSSMTVTIPVRVSQSSANDITISYYLHSGTAALPNDASAEGKLTIPAGEQQGNISLTLSGDQINTGNSIAVLQLTQVINGTFSTDETQSPFATIHVTEDDSHIQTSVNQAPEVTLNTGAIMETGATSITINDEMLISSDQETSDSDIRYTLLTAPQYGTLTDGNYAINPGETFDQDDIDSGLIKYRADQERDELAEQDSFMLVAGDEQSQSTSPFEFSISLPEIDDTDSDSDSDSDNHTVSDDVVITGELTSGSELSIDSSGLPATSAITGYQWLRDGTEISGATSATYTISEADHNSKLSVQLTLVDLLAGESNIVSASTALITIEPDIELTAHQADAVWLTHAILGEEGLTDHQQTGRVLYYLENGLSVEDTGTILIQNILAQSDNSELISAIWQNITGNPGSSEELASLTQLLDSGSLSKGQLAAMASAQSSNQTLALQIVSEQGFNPEPITDIALSNVKVTDLISIPANETITGSALDETFYGRGGNDTYAGNGGTDLVVLNQSHNSVQLNASGENQYSVITDGGTYSLSGIERLQLADKYLALDMSGTDSHGAQAARMIGAVLGSDAVSNSSYAGIALDLLDKGTSYEQLAELAISVALGSAPSNSALVQHLYENVIGTPPSDAETAAFTTMIESGVISQAGLAVLAADTDQNANQINLTGLVENGWEYQPA